MKIFPDFPRKRGRPGGVKRRSKTISLPIRQIEGLEASGKASELVEKALDFYTNEDEFLKLKAFRDMALERTTVMCISCSTKFSMLGERVGPECPHCHKPVVAITWTRVPSAHGGINYIR